MKFEQDLFRITDFFLAFSNCATKGKLNGKISQLRFFFCRVYDNLTFFAHYNYILLRMINSYIILFRSMSCCLTLVVKEVMSGHKTSSKMP